MAAGIRFCSLNETTLGEPEQDANSALTELDKGLHSEKVGECCEAIVRFPKLFEKYPFPILINSSFLKLAEVFRSGNNFVRLWVVKVFQQSEKHFDKIINVDEFIRRIFSVMHSNDPLARALCLRALGSVACVIPERQQVHHNIRICLDSHNSVEVEAAIYSAEQFASQSKSFAISMCNKISDMIQGLTTPVHMKLHLIPILRHMHHDTTTSLMVQTLCIELLSKYPAQDFVIVTLKTLSQLATATYVGVPDQVSLLVHYVVKEPRWAVRIAALSCLYDLAKHGCHHWPSEAVSQLIEIAATTRFDHHSPSEAVSQSIEIAATTRFEKLTVKILDIMILLTQSSVICHAYYKRDSALMVLCYDNSLSTNPVIACKAIKVITQIAFYCYKENLPGDMDESVDCVESYLLFLSCTGDVNDDILRSGLSNAIDLCKAQPNLCSRFVNLTASRLLQDTADSSLYLCKTLCALCSLQPATLIPFLPHICLYLRKISESNTELSETKEMLCSLIFQSSAGSGMQLDNVKMTIGVVVENSNLWTCYRIARSAVRYGHFATCHLIVTKLRDYVSSECFHFWMTALQEISAGESNFRTTDSTKLLQNISFSETSYYKAVSSLKAASTPAFSLSFQIEFTRLRSEMLHCFSSLLSTCNCFCICPPPGQTSNISGQSARDELLRYGQIINQLRKRSKELTDCAESFWKLYQLSFNADPVSLLNIQILQFICAFMANSIDAVAQNNPPEDIVLDNELKNGPLEMQLMIKNIEKAITVKNSYNLQPKVITHKHIECLKQQAEILVQSPFCYPRYFFQILQCTSVTLSVSPQPKNVGEHMLVSSGNHLTIKVDGVIQYKKFPDLFRSVRSVILTLSSQLTVRANASHDMKISAENMNTVLTQKVAPQRDFFSAEFLLALTIGGQYQVTVDVALVDQTEFIWQTGVRNSFTVKVHDENQSSRSGR